MRSKHTVLGVLLFLYLLTALGGYSFASQAIQEILINNGFQKVKVLYETKEILVLKVIKSVDPYRAGRIFTCLFRKGTCVEGSPAYMEKGKVLLIRRDKVLELDPRTMQEKVLKDLPAIARIGKDKSVEIIHGQRIVKVQDPFPKHWVYPKERGMVPCGNIFWTWVKWWNLFVSIDGKVTKKKRKRSVCILGKIIDPEKEGEVVILKSADVVVKKVNRTFFYTNLLVKFFKDFIVLHGQIPGSSEARMIVLDRDLKLKAKVDLRGYVRLLVLSGGKFYITLDTFDMGTDRTDLYRLDPENGSLEKILSYERKNNYEYYLFTPIGMGKYILIKPPYSVCLSPSWQGECTKYRHYKGMASVVDLMGNILRTIDLPKRAEVYPMDGAFIFCREECKFVNGRLEVKPLGFRGFSDRWRGEDVKVFFGEGEVFVLFGDGTKRRIPKGCRVRVHSRTAFCLYGKTRAELRDLESWKVIGETSVVEYPRHVYSNLVFKDSIAVLDAEKGKILDYKELKCKSIPLKEVVFSRDRFYAIYFDDRKLCMEAFRTDVD